MGLGAFLWGWLSDRVGTRAVVLGGGFLMGLGMALASRTATLGQFQLVFGVLVGLAAGSFFTPLTAATTRWFTSHRSLAVSLVTAGVSVGIMVVAPLAGWLITTYDWRTAMLVLGGLVWVVILPAGLLLREPPTSTPDVLADSAGGYPAGELTVSQALRTPQFAAIALTFLACCTAHAGPIFHMATHAMDRGIPALTAATVLSAASVASLAGKIMCGIIADRVGVKVVLLSGLALQAVTVSLFIFTRALGSFYAVAVLFGFAYGGVMPLYAILVRDYFGPRIMGAVFGAAAFASTLGMAFGPLVGSWVYDELGSYAWMFIASAAIGFGAVAIALTFRSPGPLSAPMPSPSAG
jgi:MFS family permease